MSTIKVNTITNVSGSGEVEVSLPLKLDEGSTPGSIAADYGYLYAKTDGKLYFNSNDVGEVELSGAGVSLTSLNTFTRGQLIDGGNASDIQLRVQGHGSQSVDIASIEKSDGTTCLEVTSAGVVGIPLATASSSTTTGALTVGGGLGIGGDIWVGDDIVMDSDGAILKFGADNEVTLTHVHNDGLLLNSDMQLQFRDGTEYIYSDTNGSLTARAQTNLKLNINGTDALTIAGSDITLSNGVSLKLQEDITFTGATAENLIKMPDNLADALNIKEGTTSYIKFTTTDSSELITFGQNVDMNSKILDNATLQSYKETIVAVTNAGSGATVTFDMDAGNIFASMGGNAIDNTITTLVFEGMTSGQSATWIVENDGTRDITFATVKRVDSDGTSNATGDIGKFPSGQEPVHTTSDEAISMYTFFAHDTDGNGTVDSIYVMVGGLNFAADS